MRRVAHLAVLAAIALTAALVFAQVQRGALDEGALALPDPCRRSVTIVGDSVDARAQRIALRALDQAACNLGRSREQLLQEVTVALDRGTDLPSRDGDELKRGLRAAIDREHDEGGINAVTAFTLANAVRFTPFAWLMRALGELRPLIEP